MPSFCATDLLKASATIASGLRLRLRLQSGIRIGPRTRLAGGRHRGSARGCRLEDRLAVRLLALQEIDDLLTGERFIFQKALGERFQIGTLFRQDLGRLIVALLDEPPNLGAD